MTTYAQPAIRRSTRHRQVVPALWRQVVRGASKAEPVHAEPDRSAFTQLEIYDGILAAIDHRAEVLDVIATSPDRETSIRNLRGLLDITHLQATAILDLPLDRFTAESRDRIAHRATELRAALTH
jgi:hypothetical protein